MQKERENDVVDKLISTASSSLVPWLQWSIGGVGAPANHVLVNQPIAQTLEPGQTGAYSAAYDMHTDYCA